MYKRQEFTIRKGRLSFRLTAPYSEKRKQAASEAAKMCIRDSHKLVIAEKPSVAQSIAAVLGATKRNDGYLSGGGYLEMCIRDRHRAEPGLLQAGRETDRRCRGMNAYTRQDLSVMQADRKSTRLNSSH